MGFFTLWRAVFHDDNGEEVGKKGFRASKKEFVFKSGDIKRTYVIDLKNGSYFQLKGLIWDTRYYQYDINSPFPYSLKREKTRMINPLGEQATQVIDSENLNIQLESKVARDLNRHNDKGLGDLFTLRNGMILLAGLALLYFLMKPESFNAIKSSFTGGG